MSAFLPSPTTAYQGGADPVRVSWLRRGEIMGSAVALTIAAAVSLVAAEEMGASAGLVFLGAVAILGLFLLEYERAIRLGVRDGMGIKGAGY